MRVETYSSFRHAVEPRAFEYQGKKHAVASITRTWRTPGQLHFYVRNQTDEFFGLTYDKSSDEWSVRAFGESCPPKPSR